LRAQTGVQDILTKPIITNAIPM